jgi:hypothetical protein
MDILKNTAQILRVFIGIAYVFLGITLIFSKINLFGLTSKSKLLFALLLVCYGLFRLYRAFAYKNENEYDKK